MTSTHQVPKKITAILAIVFLLPAVYIFGIWIKVFNSDSTPAQKIEGFTNHFPSFINDYKMVLYFMMACCLVAMILAAKSFKQPILFVRVAMWLTVIVSSLIFFLGIFQLL